MAEAKYDRPGFRPADLGIVQCEMPSLPAAVKDRADGADPDDPRRYGVPVRGPPSELHADSALKHRSEHTSLEILRAVSDAQGMAGHTIDSYNAMLSLVAEDVRNSQRSTIHGESQEHGLKCTLSFMNPTISAPHAPDPLMPSQYAPLRPHEAKLGEKQYSTGLYVDVLRTVIDLGSGRLLKSLPPTMYRRVHLGDFPCMMHSRMCWQTNDPWIDGTTKGDPGGYFIVGKSRVIVPVDNLRSQYTHVFPGGKDNLRYILEMRPIHYGSFRSTSTSWMRMMSNSLISFKPPFHNLGEVPLFGMFRVLGVETVDQAVRMIASAGMLRGKEPIPQHHPWYDRAHMDRIKWLLVHERGQSKFNLPAAQKSEKEIPNFEGWTRDDVLDWVARMTDETFRDKDHYDRVFSFQDIINSELFPNISRASFDHALMLKAQFLAFQTWLLLQVSRGPKVCPANHRDDFAGKQAQTPGFRLGTRLSQLIKHTCTEANKKIASELDKGFEPNPFEILRTCQFTANIHKAMTSGNFSASQQKQAQTGRDATELLNTHNRVVLLRDVGKGKKDTPKQNKTI